MSSAVDGQPSEPGVTGPLLRLSALAGTAATTLVVVSAVLELGTAHWGIVGVALPFLVADTVLARLTHPRLVGRTLAAAVFLLHVAVALGGLVAWSGTARWAVAVHVGAARSRSAPRCSLWRRSSAARLRRSPRLGTT